MTFLTDCTKKSVYFIIMKYFGFIIVTLFVHFQMKGHCQTLNRKLISRPFSKVLLKIDISRKAKGRSFYSIFTSFYGKVTEVWFVVDDNKPLSKEQTRMQIL